MSWIVVGLAATGAIAGAATSKKGGKDRWKRAAIGAGIGATGGLGAAALMGGGAAAGAAGAAGGTAGASPLAGIGGSMTASTISAAPIAPTAGGGLGVGTGLGVSGTGSIGGTGLLSTGGVGTLYAGGGASGLTSAEGTASGGFMSNLKSGAIDFAKSQGMGLLKKGASGILFGNENMDQQAMDIPEYEAFQPESAPVISGPIGLTSLNPQEQELLNRYFAQLQR